MPLAQLIVFLLLISCGSSGFKESSEKDKNFKLYFFGIFFTTAYFPCNKNKFADSIQFTDPTGDVKIAFLQPNPENLTFQDIAGGEIKNTSNTLELTLKFVSLPQTINTNLPPGDSVNLEFQSVFTFFVPDEIKIGLSNYSTGIKKAASWTDFTVQVFDNGKSSTSCGAPVVGQNFLKFICEKSVNPSLQKINSTSYFNVEVFYRDYTVTYRDCY